MTQRVFLVGTVGGRAGKTPGICPLLGKGWRKGKKEEGQAGHSQSSSANVSAVYLAGGEGMGTLDSSDPVLSCDLLPLRQWFSSWLPCGTLCKQGAVLCK